MPRAKTFATQEAQDRSKLRSVFAAMKMRCYNPTAQAWANYGARNISIAAEWLANIETFLAWSLGNGYEQGLEIDRIDNNGDYTPTNCRFVQTRANCRNKRVTFYVQFAGQRTPLAEVFEHLTGETSVTAAMLYKCALSRVKHGWDVTEACLKPLGKPGRPRK